MYSGTCPARLVKNLYPMDRLPPLHDVCVCVCVSAAGSATRDPFITPIDVLPLHLQPEVSAGTRQARRRKALTRQVRETREQLANLQVALAQAHLAQGTLEQARRVDRKLKVGSEVRGEKLNIRNQWHLFDGNTSHMVMPILGGTRTSLTYFTSGSWAKMSEAVRTRLSGECTLAKRSRAETGLAHGPRIDWATRGTICCGYPWRWQGAGAVPVEAVGASFRCGGLYCVGVQKTQSAGCAGLRHNLCESLRGRGCS